MSKASQLGNMLAEVMLPLGFMKVPGHHYYVRLCGDGILQGAAWSANRFPPWSLSVWFETIFQRPEFMFKSYLQKVTDWFMGINQSSDYNWDGKNATLNPNRMYEHEEDIFDHFVKNYIHLFKTCVDHRSVYEIKKSIGLNYYFLFDFNFALLLDDKEEQKKIIDGIINSCIQQQEVYSTYDVEEKHNAIFVNLIERAESRINEALSFSEYMNSREKSLKYLESCKRQNLEDFNAVMHGKATDMVNEYLKHSEIEESVPNIV